MPPHIALFEHQIHAIPTMNRIPDAQPPSESYKGTNGESKKCYICEKIGHLQQNCRHYQESNPQDR